MPSASLLLLTFWLFCRTLFMVLRPGRLTDREIKRHRGYFFI